MSWQEQCKFTETHKKKKKKAHSQITNQNELI